MHEKIIGFCLLILVVCSWSQAFSSGNFSLSKAIADDIAFDRKPQFLPQERAEFILSNGVKVSLSLEVARRRIELEKGLMFRDKLAADQGMLFLFDKQMPHAMWMQNTPAALDMIFLDCHGRVVDLILRTQPYSKEVLHSYVVSCAALEMSAGSAERLGLSLGDALIHPAFPRLLEASPL